jgi:hypothetical protein
MEISYAMIGADGQQYGPITLEQIKGWVQEGRLTGDTKVLRSDSAEWRAASQYPELGMAPAAVAYPATPAPLMTPPLGSPGIPRPAGVDPTVLRAMHRGANWFYTIAVISVLNYILMATNAGIFFIFGMGFTQLAGQLSSSPGVGIFLTAIICGMLVGLGWFARKGHAWAFIVGIIMYGLDGVVFLMVLEWLPVLFHGYVLFWLVRGLIASFNLKSNAN